MMEERRSTLIFKEKTADRSPTHENPPSGVTTVETIHGQIGN